MSVVEQQRGPSPSLPTNTAVRWRVAGMAILVAVVIATAVAWLLDTSRVSHWLAVHTGTDDLSGSWYGFWSGFGSDLAEIGLIGAVATGVYQIVRKYNCHEPHCWRVGTHPAAGGQFLLCYRHHPEFLGKRPTHEMIERLHRDHVAHTAALHDKIEGLQQQLATSHGGAAAAEGSPPAPTLSAEP
jgi:hypothetical protein